MIQVDSYILIGGRSSRLGMDKALAELGGRTLLERTVAIVRAGLSSSRITAVAANASQFAIEAIVADVPFIFDLHENRGPLGGLDAALADATAPWIFLIACDYPCASWELIALLREKISEEFGCVVPEQNDGRLQPLLGFYKVAAARTIVEAILARPRTTPPMHEVVNELNPRIVEFDEYGHLKGADQLFLNINTAADLEAARQNTDAT